MTHDCKFAEVSVHRGFRKGLKSAHLLKSSGHLQLMGCKRIYIEKIDCKWSFVYVFGLIEAASTGNKFGNFRKFYQAVVGGRPSGRNLILSSHQHSDATFHIGQGPWALLLSKSC